MRAASIIAERITASGKSLREALEDLSDEEINAQPGPNDNPIGWMTWHMLRFEDRVISHIAGEAQVWSESGGGWHEKFGLPEAPDDTGVGHSLDQVLAIRPGREDLLGYFSAVREKTLALLEGLSDTHLDREVDDIFPGRPRLPAGILLGRFFADTTIHCGQIFYVRGHLKGWGKYGR